uniref:cyclic nucleotide-gated ion channel 4-like n=1 Tax=Erigeron canadensis TaxID=72917 RepID=UPI001CB9782B|nr:cyclic nucleotide-gated ion channel 4-like [Erigeron canadensis]
MGSIIHDHISEDSYSDNDTSDYESEKDSAKDKKNKTKYIAKEYRGVQQAWDRVYVLVCFTGLFIDPLFFYTLSISESYMCLFIDGWFMITLTVVRCMTDVLHVVNMWLKFKWKRWSRLRRDKLTSCNVADHDVMYTWKRVLFNVFVILPIPQIVLWVVIPAMLKRDLTAEIMTISLIMLMFQYLPKIYHSLCCLRHMQNRSGYIFGTVWWAVVLNSIAYFAASHAMGACWYLLGLQRVVKCLNEKCKDDTNAHCLKRFLTCRGPIYYGTNNLIRGHSRHLWGLNKEARSTCLENEDNYGGYKWTLQLVTNDSRLEKILLPIFWGIMNLTTFGNLEHTTGWLEALFISIVLATGLLLVTMLIGNIKIFLHATTSKKQVMQLRMGNIERWMKRRHLPQELRKRVRNYERQRWAATRGVDEYDMTNSLPEGLRRDIKYHLCLDLVRQVPLFQHMDNLVLQNICERVKSLVFTKGETIAREGDPVQRMLFIVRGHLQSSQVLRDGVKSYCTLGPGNYSGDELLSWCVRRPFIRRLPPSSSTLVTLETIEAFGLEADDVRYVTHHFRYTFVNEKVKRSARYYSPGWRTWATVTIQLAWRRYRHRFSLTSPSFARPKKPMSRRCSSFGEDRLRLYTALLTTPKPNEDDYDYDLDFAEFFQV